MAISAYDWRKSQAGGSQMESTWQTEDAQTSMTRSVHANYKWSLIAGIIIFTLIAKLLASVLPLLPYFLFMALCWLGCGI
jgi:VIT1/CCC1 family predicted Fe2+/Mn2+ transporter